MSTKKTSPAKATKSSNRKSNKVSSKKVVRATRVNKTSRSARVDRGKKCAAPNRFLGIITLIIIGVAATVFLCAMMFFAPLCINSKISQTDAERFASEYASVEANNPFVYKNAEDVINIIEHGTGAVFIGFPSCPWCQAYAGYLADAAKTAGLDTIYYYNIEQDRANNTENYQKLVNLLGANLQYDEEGHRRIYVPDAVFVVDGRIIGNDLESSKDTAGESDPSAYWTETRVSALKSRLENYMKQIVAATGCNDSCDK